LTVVLSTLGSRGVRFDVTPAALSEAGRGGVTLWVESPYWPEDHPDRRTAYTFTAEEVMQLWEQLRAVLLEEADS
jgi:hypothetical protein